MKNIRTIFILIAVVILWTGCSSSNSKKTTFAYKTYHDITFRYNFYFNANLILNQNLSTLQSNSSNDYTQLLPLNTYGIPGTSADLNPDMDKIIKKASIGIQLHDNSKWVDDAYLLIGKANYMKGNYEEAVKTFQFITSEFEKGVRKRESLKKRKKLAVKEKKYPNKNFHYEGILSHIKHKPARWEAMIWIVKSYSAMNKFNEAQSIISFIRSDKSFPYQLKRDFELVVAENYIRQRDYANASKSLETAISLSNNKKQNTRYTFILAQLYQLDNNSDKAIEKFNDVLKLRPDYEMELYAKLNIAQLSKNNQTVTTEDVIALLNSLIRNEKYKHFLGEIYYALADLHLNQNHIIEAERNFLLAVEKSTNNKSKADSYLALGNINYDKEKYVIAHAYYDSTITILPKENVAFESINTRKIILEDLVAQINVISIQDSLQRMAKMTDEELQKFLSDQNKARNQEDNLRTSEDQQMHLQDWNQKASVSSSWPFDNPSMRSRGFNEFKNTWGNRQYEDDWKRSNKNTMTALSIEIDNTESESVAVINTVEDLKKNLPLDEEKLAASDLKIVSAYYKLGTIYKDQLNNDKKAIETFEKLLARYPKNKFRLESAYNLYLLHSNTAKAEPYKQIILSEFGDNLIAQIIRDPNFLESNKKKQQELHEFYAVTYQLFLDRNFDQVLKRKKQADSIFSENTLKAKFDMLEALTYSQTGDLLMTRQLLEKLTTIDNDNEIKDRAIAFLNSMEGFEYENLTQTEKAKQFVYEPNSKHFLMIVFKDINTKTNDVINNIATYNDQFFQLDRLKINTLLLNNETQVVLVQDFNNMQKSQTYYNGIRYNEKIFNGIKSEDYIVFTISQHNYGVFFREKNINDYLTFFSKNYLKQ